MGKGGRLLRTFIWVALVMGMMMIQHQIPWLFRRAAVLLVDLGQKPAITPLAHHHKTAHMLLRRESTYS